MATIADRLREEREKLGYSQTAFGALLGKVKQTVIDWESGKSFPNAAFLAAIAAAGADVQYILTGRKSVPALCVEQERAGYVVEVLSPAEAQALATLRASGVLGGVSVNISSNAGQAAGIIQGDMNGTGRSKRRPR